MRFLNWLILWAFVSVAQAQQLTVGTSQNINIDNDHGIMRSVKTGAAWNRHAYIYPKALLQDLPMGALVQALAFNRSVSASGVAAGQLSGQTRFKLYVANVPADSLQFGAAKLAWTQAVQTAQLVYDADPQSVVGQTHGFKRFNFSQSFAYTGGALAVFVEYTQTAGTVGEVLWTYNNNNKATGGLSEYVEVSTKYSFGTGTTLGDSLVTGNVRHPNFQLFYTTAPCLGQPSSGTIASLPMVCHGDRAVLQMQGATVGSGISHEWQQFTEGRWQAVAEGGGRQTTRLTTAPLTQTTAFRLVTTCQNSGLSASSDSLVVAVNTAFTVPFSENFNSLSGTAACWRTQILADVGTKARPFIRFDSLGLAPRTTPFEGDRLARFNAFGCDAGDKIRLIAPPLTTLGVPSVDVSFQFFEDNEDGVSNLDKMTLQFSTDGQNWQSVAAQQRYNPFFPKYGASVGRWYERQYTLPTTAAQQPLLYVALLFESDYGSDIYVDQFQVAASKPIAAQGNCDSVVLAQVSGHNWYRIKTSDGQTLADINPNGQNLGQLVVHYYVHNGATRLTATGLPVLNRNITLTPQYPLVLSPISLRLYYTNAELDRLKRSVPSILPENIRLLRSAAMVCDSAVQSLSPTVVTQSGSGSYGGDFYVAVSTDTLGRFFIGAGEAQLPLDLVAFYGKTIGATHFLTWETASERQTSHFEVQKATADRLDWQTIARVAAAKESAVRRVYQAQDKAEAGIVYYRLKMVDLDGKTAYSKTIALQQAALATTLKVYPNPVSEVLFFDCGQGQNTPCVTDGLEITNALGQTVRLVRPIADNKINVADLENGVYFLKIDGQMLRFVKK